MGAHGGVYRNPTGCLNAQGVPPGIWEHPWVLVGYLQEPHKVFGCLGCSSGCLGCSSRYPAAPMGACDGSFRNPTRLLGTWGVPWVPTSTHGCLWWCLWELHEVLGHLGVPWVSSSTHGCSWWIL